MAKERPLQKIFTEVPPKYDLINRLFSFRLDETWRKKTAVRCLENNPKNIIDLCTGTGDLALRVARMSKGKVKVTGLDFSTTMLEKAKEKMSKQPQYLVEFIFGDVAKLPFNDGHFDTAGISFAFRNLTFRNPDTPIFLSEILRILKKGGRFVIVESSQPRSKAYRWIFHLYMNVYVSWLGRIISGNKGAYKYFSYSVTHFYTPEEIRELLLKTGFTEVRYEPLFGGVAGIHVAIK